MKVDCKRGVAPTRARLLPSRWVRSAYGLTGGVLLLLLGSLFFNLAQFLGKVGFAFEEAKHCVGCFALDYLSAFPPNDNFRPLAEKLL